MITAALTRYWSSNEEKPVPPRDLLSLGHPDVPTFSPLYPIGRGEGLGVLSAESDNEPQD